MLAIASYVSRPFPLHNAKCFILLYGFDKFSWVDGMSWAHALVVTKRRTVQRLNLRPCGFVVHLIRCNC